MPENTAPLAAAKAAGVITPTSAPAQSGEDEPKISLAELLSTCIDAAQRGCNEIRRVHNALDRDEGALQEVDYKIAGDVRSALTAADLAAQEAVVDALETVTRGAGTWGH